MAWPKRTEPLTQKQCNCCKVIKKAAEFYASKKNGPSRRVGYLSYICKECTKNKAKEWKENNADKRKSGNLMRLYGVTLEERNNLLAKQGHCCAICKTKSPGAKDWHVDHCHETNKVRGVLCSTCNLGLGYFKDDVDYFRNAIEYLEKNKTS
jgi:hypothetical protein